MMFHSHSASASLLTIIACTIRIQSEAVSDDGICRHSCAGYCSKTANIDVAICSCSESCLTWNNCCSNFLQVCKDVTNVTDFLATVTTTDEDAVETLTDYGECNYYSGLGYTNVIGKCPTKSDPYFHEGCNEKSKNLTPVRANNNPYLNFVNIHCALCHGYNQTDVTQWEFSYLCPVDNVTDLTSIINECIIRFWSNRLEGLICYPYDRPTRFGNTEQDPLCRYFIDPVGLHDPLTVTYKNRHCALLDGVDETLICHVSSKSDDRPNKNSLSVLFDMDKGTADIDKVTIRLCALHQIYDPLFTVCRDLHCPLYHYSRWGKCYQNATIFIDPDTQPYQNRTGELKMSFVLHFIEDGFVEILHSYGYISNVSVSEPVLDPNSSTDCLLESKSEIKMVEIRLVFESEIHIIDLENFLTMMDEFPCVSMVTLLNISPGRLVCGEGYKLQLYTDVDLQLVDDEMFAVVELGDQKFFYEFFSIGFKVPGHQYLTAGRAGEIHVCRRNNASLSCPVIVLKPSEFEVLNDTILIKRSDKIIPKDEFRIVKGKAHVCEYLSSMKLQFFNFDDYQQLVSMVVTGISCFCLMLCLFVYIRFKEMRTLSGKLNACLCLWLMLAQLTLMINGLDELICRVIATICHFLWLAVFGQMSVIAVNMALTFHRLTPIDSVDTDARFKQLTMSALIPPVIIVVVCTGLDVGLTDSVWKVGYGASICSWISNDLETMIIFFYTPVCLSFVINFVCFVITLCGIEKSIKASSMISKDTNRSERRRCVIYAKLSSIMGLTWITGIIAAIVDYPVLWYIYIILNGLQGFFIFLSFMCNRRTLRMLRHVFQPDRKEMYTSTSKPASNSSPDLN